MEALWGMLQRGEPIEELSSAFDRLTAEGDFEEIGERLLSLDDGLRLHAVAALEMADNPLVVGTLAALYEDVLDSVRERSLLILNRLGGDVLAEPMVSGLMLEDPVPAVRAAAVQALAASRSPKARSLMLEALEDEPDAGVRARLEAQLRKLG